MISDKEKIAADAARLTAELKRTKLHAHSLENTLEQKVMFLTVFLILLSLILIAAYDLGVHAP